MIYNNKKKNITESTENLIVSKKQKITEYTEKKNPLCTLWLKNSGWVLWALCFRE